MIRKSVPQRWHLPIAGLALLLVGVLGAMGGIVIANMSSQPAAPATAAPFGTPMRLSAADMPIGGDCLPCHATNSGGVAVISPPALAHPLKGWTDCSACHSPGRLVQTAPGHSGIHADQCLLCHKASEGPAPSRPHPGGANMDCLSCHGTLAPLPEHMTARAGNCWLCHRGIVTGVPTPAPGATAWPSGTQWPIASPAPSPTPWPLISPEPSHSPAPIAP